MCSFANDVDFANFDETGAGLAATIA